MLEPVIRVGTDTESTWIPMGRQFIWVMFTVVSPGCWSYWTCVWFIGDLSFKWCVQINAEKSFIQWILKLLCDLGIYTNWKWFDLIWNRMDEWSLTWNDCFNGECNKWILILFAVTELVHTIWETFILSILVQILLINWLILELCFKEEVL